MPPRKNLVCRSSEIDFDAIWVNLGGKIAIESPEKLSDNDLENIIDIWNRKPRRIAV